MRLSLLVKFQFEVEGSRCCPPGRSVQATGIHSPGKVSDVVSPYRSRLVQRVARPLAGLRDGGEPGSPRVRIMGSKTDIRNVESIRNVTCDELALALKCPPHSTRWSHHQQPSHQSRRFPSVEPTPKRENMFQAMNPPRSYGIKHVTLADRGFRPSASAILPRRFSSPNLGDQHHKLAKYSTCELWQGPSTSKKFELVFGRGLRAKCSLGRAQRQPSAGAM